MKAVVRVESWPIRGEFRIARGARTAAEVVVLELHDAGFVGRAECVPYGRYGETIEAVAAGIESACAGVASSGVIRRISTMPPGAARNALDCAMWDLRAKREGSPVWSLAGCSAAPRPVRTMRTVSVSTPAGMKDAAAKLGGAAVIKGKVDGRDDLARIAAVHEGAPAAELVVDANEGWTYDQTARMLPELQRLGVTVLEQPLPAAEDEALEELEHAVAICADESFHDRSSFSAIRGRYDMVNVKLDKSGGLTEALACSAEARRLGIPFMVGCMVSTSLAVEPALILTRDAAYVDLDGPLLLETDRTGAGHDRARGILRPSASVWGAP